jgi:hypothetical protein
VYDFAVENGINQLILDKSILFRYSEVDAQYEHWQLERE